MFSQYVERANCSSDSKRCVRCETVHTWPREQVDREGAGREGGRVRGASQVLTGGGAGQVCTTSPCMVCGAYEVLDALKKHLGVNVGETTKDGKFHLMEAECLGCCCNAPMMQIAGPITNDAYYEDLTPENAIKVVEQLARGETPKVGSQIGRHGSIGPQGKTSLLEEPSGPYCREI